MLPGLQPVVSGSGDAVPTTVVASSLPSIVASIVVGSTPEPVSATRTTSGAPRRTRA